VATAKPEHGQFHHGKGSKGDANSRRGSSGTLVLGVRSSRENPEVVSNGEGGALGATKALPTRHHEPLKEQGNPWSQAECR